MKVTDSSTFRLMKTNLDRITTDLSDLRNQGATGLKFITASDDPGSVQPVLTARTQIQESERYIDTLGKASDKMAYSDSHLAHVEDLLVRAKEIAINSVNSSLNQSDLDSLADEIAELRNELLGSANAIVDGKYLFAGYQENTVPFVENPAYDSTTYDINDVTTWPYHYQGDYNPTELEIASNEYLEVNVTGNELFMGISNEIAEAGYSSLSPAPGDVDIFTVLMQTEEAIRAGDVTDGSIETQIDQLEIAANQNRTHRSVLGYRASRIESATTQQEEALVDLKETLSRYQDADIIEVYNDIVQKESAYEAALNITARVSQISILDYF